MGEEQLVNMKMKVLAPVQTGEFAIFAQIF
jgi:hypothetical protein